MYLLAVPWQTGSLANGGWDILQVFSYAPFLRAKMRFLLF